MWGLSAIFRSLAFMLSEMESFGVFLFLFCFILRWKVIGEVQSDKY